MAWRWLTGRKSFEVPCTVEVEHTNEYLGAHVHLHGIEVGPGDEVRVHEAPTDVGFGEKISCERRATVVRGGWLDRLWARAIGVRELHDLYDVSFTPRRQL